MPVHKITTLVVDDEPLARRVLCDLVARESDMELLGTASDGEEAVTLIDRLEPDVVFLDIQMPGRLGHDVARRITATPLIVFATAFDQYAVAAFELQAVDYLLKPFARRRFQRAMERVRLVLESKEARETLASRVDVALQPAGPIPQLYVRERGTIRAIDTDSVRRIEACDDYVRLFAGEGSFLLFARLGDLEERLRAGGFVRIHRSHLVNLSFFQAAVAAESGRYTLRLKTGEKLPVSRTGGRKLQAALKRAL